MSNPKRLDRDYYRSTSLWMTIENLLYKRLSLVVVCNHEFELFMMTSIT